MNYTLLYDGLFGGVSALSKRHFNKVNGYSNQFWGWGGSVHLLTLARGRASNIQARNIISGEDDDMWNRIMNAGLNVTRPSKEFARLGYAYICLGK